MSAEKTCGAVCLSDHERAYPCALPRGHDSSHADARGWTWGQSREELGMPPHPLIAAAIAREERLALLEDDDDFMNLFDDEDENEKW